MCGQYIFTSMYIRQKKKNSPKPCTGATLKPVLSSLAVARTVGAKDRLSTLMTRLALSAGTKRPTLDSVFILLRLGGFCVTNACRHFARQLLLRSQDSAHARKAIPAFKMVHKKKITNTLYYMLVRKINAVDATELPAFPLARYPGAGASRTRAVQR